MSCCSYDTAPTQDGELDTLIEQAMSLIGPVELSACTVGMSPRSTILRYLFVLLIFACPLLVSGQKYDTFD